MFRVNKKFVVLMIISYIFAFIQGGDLPYRIFYGFSISFIIGLLYILVEQRNVEIQVKLNRQLFSTGDHGEFTIVVKNYGILPNPYLCVMSKTLASIDPDYRGDVVFLGADDTKWIRSEIKFNKRGIYNFGDIELSMWDFLYIFERKKHTESNLFVKVYPKIYRVDRFVANGSDIFKNVVNNKSRIEDQFSIKDVRKYNQGDNLKRINWKVSAKHGELYVRNIDTVSGEESNLFLDMGKMNGLIDPVGNLEEKLVNLTASIINYMQLKGIKTNLFISSKNYKKIEVNSRETFNQLMEIFLTEKSDGENTFENYINSNLSKIPRLSWIGVITGRIDRGLSDNLIKMKDAGYNITVFYYSDTLDNLSYVPLLKKIGIQCISFYEIINSAER